MTPNRNNKYNPTQYSDVDHFPSFNKEALFDDDDGFADGMFVHLVARVEH